MFTPFRLKRPIGPDSVMDRDDVLNTRRALNELGFLKAPDYGLTPFPDALMIAAVENFQRRHGLKVDGVMNPDGPTAEALGRAVADRQSHDRSRGFVEGEWDWLRGKRRPFPTIFDVVAEIGLGRRNDPRDVLAARRALAWAGHLPRQRATDDLGISPDLFDAVRAFQRESGLTVDGWMGPGGVTARALDDAIAPKIQARLRVSSGDAGAADADRPGIQVAKVDKPPFPNNPIGTMTLETLQGGGAAAIGAGVAAQELLRQQQRRQGTPEEARPAPLPSGTQPRTDLAPLSPPLPGFEPPKDKDRLPTKTESPVQTVEMPDLSQPIPDVAEPTIFVYPVPPEELANAGTIIERKGNEETRKELESIRDYYEDMGWKHIGGGRYSQRHEKVLSGEKNAGDEQKERHIPGHGKAFEADTRPGGHFADLTFEMPDGRIVHIQSVDVDRHGKPTERELHVAERIRHAEENAHVILIPKGAQLEKVRRFRVQE